MADTITNKNHSRFKNLVIISKMDFIKQLKIYDNQAKRRPILYNTDDQEITLIIGCMQSIKTLKKTMKILDLGTVEIRPSGRQNKTVFTPVISSANFLSDANTLDISCLLPTR